MLSNKKYDFYLLVKNSSSSCRIKLFGKKNEATMKRDADATYECQMPPFSITFYSIRPNHIAALQHNNEFEYQTKESL